MNTRPLEKNEGGSYARAAVNLAFLDRHEKGVLGKGRKKWESRKGGKERGDGIGVRGLRQSDDEKDSYTSLTGTPSVL